MNWFKCCILTSGLFLLLALPLIHTSSFSPYTNHDVHGGA